MAATFPIKKVCTKPGMVQFTILRLEARQRTLFAWQDAQAITAGVSDERCKWPNTLSCGLARKGRYDRNTGGRESAIIEGSG
jgi:hypothetical protein